MTLALPDLPYAYDALAPHMSEETLRFHHDKHHRKYLDKLKTLIEGTGYAGDDLDAIIRRSAEKEDTKVFNNAAQAWNHTFFWNSMAPNGGGKPKGRLAERLDASFGDFASFAKAFKKVATGQFGSGWAWLSAAPDGRIAVCSTANAGTGLLFDGTPLITCDVWEHAYYLDYQNRRGDFVAAFLEHMVDWNAAARRFAPVAERAAA